MWLNSEDDERDTAATGGEEATTGPAAGETATGVGAAPSDSPTPGETPADTTGEEPAGRVAEDETPADTGVGDAPSTRGEPAVTGVGADPSDTSTSREDTSIPPHGRVRSDAMLEDDLLHEFDALSIPENDSVKPKLSELAKEKYDALAATIHDQEGKDKLYDHFVRLDDLNGQYSSGDEDEKQRINNEFEHYLESIDPETLDGIDKKQLKMALASFYAGKVPDEYLDKSPESPTTTGETSDPPSPAPEAAATADDEDRDLESKPVAGTSMEEEEEIEQSWISKHFDPEDRKKGVYNYDSRLKKIKEEEEQGKGYVTIPPQIRDTGIGKKEKTFNLGEGKTHVILKTKRFSSGEFKNIRDVDVEIKKGPALVALGMSGPDGKPLEGRPKFIIEYDKSGNPTDSVPDLSNVHISNEEPKVAYILHKDGNKAVLPMNGDKVLALKKQISTHKQKQQLLDSVSGESLGGSAKGLERGRETPRVSAAKGSEKKPAEAKTPDEIAAEYIELVEKQVNLEADAKLDPKKAEALKEANEKLAKFKADHTKDSNPKAAENKKIMEGAEKAAKDQLNRQAKAALEKNIKSFIKYRATGNDTEAKKAQAEIKKAEAILETTGSSKDEIKEIRKDTAKEVYREAVKEEFVYKMAAWSKNKPTEVQEAAKEALSDEVSTWIESEHKASRASEQARSYQFHAAFIGSYDDMAKETDAIKADEHAKLNKKIVEAHTSRTRSEKEKSAFNDLREEAKKQSVKAVKTTPDHSAKPMKTTGQIANASRSHEAPARLTGAAPTNADARRQRSGSLSI